jgi:hypothetical protein
MLSTTHRLDDGTRVRLRLARPSDGAGLRAFFGERSDLLVRRFTFYDPRERIVLVATKLEEGAERVVGLADGDSVFGQGEDLRELLSEAAEYARRRRRVA